MKLMINQNQKISEIIEKFNQVFPFLKIEFFSNPINSFGNKKRNLIIYADKTLGECRTIVKQGELTVSPHMTVSDLENKFNSIYGLLVQVYRKSGKAWLETTLTDSWTLEEQNNQGRALSSEENKIINVFNKKNNL